MKRTNLVKILTIALSGVLVAAVLGGCMAQNTANTEQTANRQYMSQVNQAMEDLTNRLDGFNQAVTNNDLVGMKTQADNAFKAIDDLNALEAPEGLKDIQTAYVDGCNDLKDALTKYIDLYTEIESATEEEPFDYATYDARLKEIQDTYDSGIEHLEEADKKATEMPN
ncbi:hypothetical protein [Raoultibacter phocaeensis]|uniref:hypothetical protein n=1 Tax=Raoultibacter phocaeensis TaxID=2479841 RepID=UPI00111920C0|nr:hypothetical protein [Raoultibacter phocaeensis]